MKTVSVDLADLKKLIDYSYEDEERHFEEEGDYSPGHIFHVLKRLNEAVNAAQKAKKPIVVKRVIRSGELNIRPGTKQAELLEQAGANLDGSCSGEILGDVCFQAEDGKYYRMMVEALIEEVDKDYADNIESMYDDEDEAAANEGMKRAENQK